jgi:putative transposase
MSQSLARVLVHIVFSTKGRAPWLNDAIRSDMCAYLATGLSDADHVVVRIGGVTDHVHVALFLARTESLAKLIATMKTSSSKWIKGKGSEFARFEWQKGYAAFSVGLCDKAALIRYIDTQTAHHQRRDFQAEMRAMFAKYEVPIDERYLWD